MAWNDFLKKYETEFLNIIIEIESKIKGGLLLDIKDYERLISVGHQVILNSGTKVFKDIIEKAKNG